MRRLFAAERDMIIDEDERNACDAEQSGRAFIGFDVDLMGRAVKNRVNSIAVQPGFCCEADQGRMIEQRCLLQISALEAANDLPLQTLCLRELDDAMCVQRVAACRSALMVHTALFVSRARMYTGREAEGAVYELDVVSFREYVERFLQALVADQTQRADNIVPDLNAYACVTGSDFHPYAFR